MNGLFTVSIACADEAEAQALARLLVEARLAACVQSHAIRSTYVWQGAVEETAEVMLTAKTLAAKLPELEAAVKARHSYEVPEILAVPVAWVSEVYAEWVRLALTSNGVEGPATPRLE